jgi:hypothetical protein
MATKAKSKLHQWLAANPLRKYIDSLGMANGSGAAKVIAQIGVSRQSAYAWMAGVYSPKIEGLIAIEKVTGITPEQWLQWQKNRPKRGHRNAQESDH